MTRNSEDTKPAKRGRGRPSVHGERMKSRSVTMPVGAWRALDDEAHEARVSCSALIRQKLGVSGARRLAKG